MMNHWVVLVFVATILGGTFYVVAAGQEQVYEAVAVVTFSDVQVRGLDPDEPAGGGPVRQLRNRVRQIESSAVMDRASELLGGRADASTLLQGIEVVAEPELSDAVLIVSRAPNPGDAAAFANAVGEAYQEVIAAQERERMLAAIDELDRSIARMEERIGELDATAADGAGATDQFSALRHTAIAQLVELASRRERLEAAAVVADGGIASFERALPPVAPVGPRPRTLAILGTLIGLALASAWAYWWEGRGVARGAGEVRRRLRVPLLAEVPRVRERRLPWTSNEPVTSIPRSYEFLAVALDRILDERTVDSMVFAGVRRRRGHATVAQNCALALCEEGRRVLLVDADLTERRLTRLWRLGDSPGLADMQNPELSLHDISASAGGVSGGGTWAFMPAGTRGATSARRLWPTLVRRLLEEVGAATPADLSARVVLHASPVLDAADVSAVARLTEGVVLQIFVGTSFEDVERAVEMIELSGGRVLGCVFVSRRWLPLRSGTTTSSHARPLTEEGRPVSVE